MKYNFEKRNDGFWRYDKLSFQHQTGQELLNEMIFTF